MAPRGPERDLERQRALLESFGVQEQNVAQTLNNAKLCNALSDIAAEHGLEGGCSREVGALLIMVATKFPATALRHRGLLVDYIKEGKISRNDQCTAALRHLAAVGGAELDVEAFDAAAGVGVVVSPDDVRRAVAAVCDAHADEIAAQRYRFNITKLIQPVKRSDGMAWADAANITAALQERRLAMLGPMTDEDTAVANQPVPKPKKTKAATPTGKAAVGSGHRGSAVEGADSEEWRTADPYRFLPDPAANTGVHEEVHFADGHVERYSNTREQLAAHLSATGGKVVTRFPPEPNGYLHIGHAKAMFVDFGMAQRCGGRCYLRFDDTNPEAESTEFIEHIKEIVTWMGWRYCEVTHSSDYFDQLYAFAVRLIDADLAYVCHQTGDEIEQSRKMLEPSPWRRRPVAESRRLFEDMRRGLLNEGEATLRLKMDPANDNRNLGDLIAYRIKFVPHPHVGRKWCVYPSYDFTHCVIDSLENVSHSLCTLEFASRRASYYWLLDKLDLYMPVVWEYSRLNIQHHVMSKRKLQKLVHGELVRGWDDPRLPTLAGMRRRGLTPEGINSLCQEQGVTRSDSELELQNLFYHTRNHLNATCPRALVVLRPLRLVIRNVPESHLEHVEAQRFPMRADSETYKVPFSRVCFIERTDFRVADEKDYYGLAPGKSVMLRYAYPVTYVNHSLGEDGEVIEVEVDGDLSRSARKAPKGVLNWIAQPSPGREPDRAEARLYADKLFQSPHPGDLPGDEWLGDLNPESETVLEGIYISAELATARELDRFQFERLGYFCVDRDSRPGAMVFNRTCALRDTYR